MAALAKDVDAFHHHAFVQADGLEPGRLADHRGATQRAPRFGQCAGAGHGAFFIAGRKDQQWLLERLIQQRQHRLDGQGKKPFMSQLPNPTQRPSTSVSLSGSVFHSAAS